MLKVGHYFEHWGLDYRLGSLRFRLMTMSVTDAVFGDKRKVGFLSLIHIFLFFLFFTGECGG